MTPEALGEFGEELTEQEWADLVRHGRPPESGIKITLPLTQDELASWVGASREAVAKALRTLRACGYVRTQRRMVTVVDIEWLRRHAR
ncbi:MAG: winged helix-turn-helix domain-containing protein [Pseudonocardiales bacterium]|nr:winged helix-turn-helix domain-containing protein [Pseudonocardiales bacterium]MBV9030898.1 winged helix-turn-helix domain-containing protein [Pseudonocardiales bacterium]